MANKVMLEKKIRTAARKWLSGRSVPATNSGRARLAAQFVDYLGTMNQEDRKFEPFDKYATDSWVESETQDKSNSWKDDKFDDVGFGIPRTSSTARKKAIAATELAFAVLGEDQSDKAIEAQARGFMAMPMKSITASLKRVGNDPDTGIEENPEFDADDEDMSDTLEETTDIGDHDDEDEEDSLEQASVDEDSLEQAIASLENKVASLRKMAKSRGRKSKNESENFEKERTASDEDVDAELASLLASDDDEDDIKTDDDDDLDIEADDELDIDDDKIELDDEDDSDGNELASLLADDEETHLASRRTASKRKVKSLRGVTVRKSSGNREIDELSRMWGSTPVIDWNEIGM